MNILFVAGKLDIGGIECWLRSLIHEFNKKESLKFFIVVDRPDIGVLEEDFIVEGVSIIRLPSPKKTPYKYLKCLYKALLINNIAVVHSNVGLMSGFVVAVAFCAKIKTRVCHLHSNAQGIIKVNLTTRIKNLLGRLLIELFSTKKLAVSNQSKRNYLLKSNVEILPCGISTSFNENYVNRDLDNFVTGHTHVLSTVGRLENTKNQSFIIECLPCLPDYFKYLIIGMGSEVENLKKQTTRLSLDDRVFFAGNMNDVKSVLYKYADIFVFPSLHEGLGIAAIEAQIAGLPVIASTNVPKEIDVSGKVKFLPLDHKDAWIESIISWSICKKNIQINHNMLTTIYDNVIFLKKIYGIN